MSTGLLSIGVGGMNAAQMGLLTTEHNIANASTDGYNRQRTHQATNISVMTGAGAMGQGTHVTTIERMYDQFLSGQVNRSQSNVSELDTYYSEIAQIDNMLADANAGLSPAMQDFFKGVQQVAADPSSLTARQSMVSAAQAMVSRYQGLQSRLDELADGVNGQISSVVQEINSYAQQIANLNDRIVVAESSVHQPANDLLDQRDQLVSELNKLIKVDTTVDSNGAYNVFIGTGQQLVVGSRVTTMTYTAASSDPQRIVVGLQSTGGNILELPESLVTGGQLGGLVQFRLESLEPAINQLGKVATSMALTFNAQHELGQNLLGNISGETGFVGDFFTIGQPQVVANAYNNPASPVVSATLTNPPPNNGGNFYTDLTGSDYSLIYDGANFKLTRLDDNTSWTGASINDINTQLAADPQGFTLNVTAGTFTTNDSFIIQPTRLAAGSIAINSRIVADNRLIAAASPVRSSAGLTNTGNAKITNAQTVAGFALPPAGTLPFTLTYGPPVQIDGYNRQTAITNYDFSGTGLAQFDVDGIGVTLTDNYVDAAGLKAEIESDLPGYTVTVNGPGDISISKNGSLAPVVISNTDVNAQAAGFVDSLGTAGTAPTTGSLTITPASAASQDFSVTVGGVTTVYSGGVIPYDTATGAQIEVNGITFTVTGTPAVGDQFLIERNTGGVADGSNIVALGKLQTQSTMAGGTANFQTSYTQLVSDIGNKTREIQVTSQAQQSLLDQSESAREAYSGVNLDEEAANLIRYQQAYQASAKMLSIGTKLFETLLSL